MEDENKIEEEYEMPIHDFDLEELEQTPLMNTSLVVEESKVIFPKLDMVIDLNGIKQFSNPQNNMTPFKIYPANMTELEELGKGAAGTVKRALYKYDNFEIVVAIKQIQANDKEKRNQLLNDLKTFLTGEICQYLVKFYGCYYHAGFVKQVIEYMNLGSLRNLTNLVAKQKLYIEENDLKAIITSILRGLHHIHKIKHQIHRDIKPENILMNEAGEIKITDFGVAKYIESTMGGADTFVDIGVYMSPERFTVGKSKYNYKCDVWGVGLILYELATGKEIPYRIGGNATPLVLFSKIVNGKAPSLDDCQNRSNEMKNFLNLCLVKNPDNRWSVEELLEHPWIKTLNEVPNLMNFMQQVKHLLQNN